MRVVLAHDYLIQMGGAEKVLQSFQEIYQDSPVFVLVYDRKLDRIFPAEKIKTSWLQYMPAAISKYQWYLTLMPQAIESFGVKGADVILSSSSSMAKGIITGKNTMHICYCHTPTRYLWHGASEYIKDLGYSYLVKKIIPIFLRSLKNWDLVAAQRVDVFIANSKAVQQRIKQYYNRDSKVIYPPVETDKYYIDENLGDYYLIGGRLVGYKRYDVAVKAFTKLGIKLKVFGDGPEYSKLKKMAGKNIEFLGNVSDSVKSRLYRQAIAFIYPQVEDFGITAIESMASGRPVIAYFKGGAIETVVSHQTGEFFEEQTWECLANKIIYFKPEKYDSTLIKQHAERFNLDRFKVQIKNYINNEWIKFETNRVFTIKK